MPRIVYEISEINGMDSAPPLQYSLISFKPFHFLLILISTQYTTTNLHCQYSKYFKIILNIHNPVISRPAGQDKIFSEAFPAKRLLTQEKYAGIVNFKIFFGGDSGYENCK